MQIAGLRRRVTSSCDEIGTALLMKIDLPWNLSASVLSITVLFVESKQDFA